MGGRTRPGARMIDAAAALAIGVREATSSDIDQVVAIEQASFSDPWSREAFHTFASHVGPLFLVAYADGEPERVLAYCVVMRIGPEAELLNIAVTSATRGKGIAGILLDRLFSIL